MCASEWIYREFFENYAKHKPAIDRLFNWIRATVSIELDGIENRKIEKYNQNNGQLSWMFCHDHQFCVWCIFVLMQNFRCDRLRRPLILTHTCFVCDLTPLYIFLLRCKSLAHIFYSNIEAVSTVNISLAKIYFAYYLGNSYSFFSILFGLQSWIAIVSVCAVFISFLHSFRSM